MSKSIAEKLRMSHLEDASDAELKNQLEEAAIEHNDPEEEEKKELADKKLQKEYNFQFNFVDDRGEPWVGEFQNKILDINEKGKAAVLEASLNQGMPHDSIPRLIATVHHAIAHMTYSLEVRPPWAKNLRKLNDVSVVLALFEEVASHEATFLGRGQDQEESKEGGE